MADLGAIGVRVDDRRAMPAARPWHPYDLGASALTFDRAMSAPWVRWVPDQLWWLVLDPVVMPRLLAPYAFDNRVEEQVPWLSLGYGESWFTRRRLLREPTYTLSLEQGMRPPCYPEDLIQLGGQVAHPYLSKVGVCLYGWGSRLVYCLVRPDETGAWRAEVPPGRCGITYQADGAQPVTHGPYSF